MDRSAKKTPNPGPDDDRRAPIGGSPPDASSLAGMGIEFVVAMLLGLFGGRWLDGKLGTAPWLMIAGVFLSAGASMVAMYRKVFPPEKPSAPTDKSP
jgi:F0F1-type ATP synthase assembly protein I